ncbi:hypothetical protein [Mumia sp. DW29H23]|uniref:hypothetical protein n=1 Tax=Mumia sp. DW29H23 TaxID=3421241 RepID=UPI003D69711C
MNEMAEAIRRQMDQAHESMMVDRNGWTDQQWVEDAKHLMDHVDGAVTSLLNGHAHALIRLALPRLIETPAERAALPRETVVRSAGGTIACRYDDASGFVFGMSSPIKWSDLGLPLTVLWDPEADR